MPTLQRDPISGHNVIAAENRSQRPNAWGLVARANAAADCPFCPGAEDQTLQPTWMEPQNGPWNIRVVPNLYPIVDEQRAGDSKPVGDWAHGVHEVVVETPIHELKPEQWDDQHLAAVFNAFHQRCVALRQRPDVSYVTVFKNFGTAAGASLDHPHAQIVATGFVPPWVEQRRQRALTGGSKTSHRAIVDGAHAGRGVITKANGALALAPPVPRWPYETWIVPELGEGGPHFGEANPSTVASVAQLTSRVICGLRALFSQCAFNYVIHSAPLVGAHNNMFWFVQVIPRLSQPAGFELATGAFVNSIPAHVAAAALRETLTAT